MVAIRSPLFLELLAAIAFHLSSICRVTDEIRLQQAHRAAATNGCRGDGGNISKATSQSVAERSNAFRQSVGLSATSRFEWTLQKARRVNEKLQALASLKVATLIGCPF